MSLVCVGLLVASWERGRGNLHHITSVVSPDDDVTPEVSTVRPGGQDAIRLSRSASQIGRDPEFLSATLLPGRGMNVYQITALIPGHGEVPLLYAPPLDEAGPIFSGQGPDANGSNSTTVGGAFLLPWARRLSGMPGTTPGSLQTNWQGQRLTFPASSVDSTLSTQGMMLNLVASDVKTEVQNDGQSAQAIFHAGSFNGSLPSTVEVAITVELAAHTIDLAISVSNTGKAPIPFGIGWQPLFAIPSGDRANAQLVIPSSTVFETNKQTGLPTGRTLQIDGTELDLSRTRGTRLGASLDQTYTKLQSTLAADGPVAELRDSVDNVSLREISTTTNIMALHVSAPAYKRWVSIGPDTNADDPLGPEWAGSGNSGIATLAPGATMDWKVRLEIAPFSAADVPVH